MRAVLELAAFLEVSGDDVIDPDAAVQQLEELTHQLRKLTTAEKQRLFEIARELAAAERRDPGRARRAAFFEQFAEASGLADEPSPRR